MNNAFQNIGSILLSVFIVMGLGWLLWQALRKSESPGRLLGRWLGTIVIFVGAFMIAMPLISFGATMTVAAGVLIIAAASILVGVIWAPSWAHILLSPLTDSRAFPGNTVFPNGCSANRAFAKQRAFAGTG